MEKLDKYLNQAVQGHSFTHSTTLDTSEERKTPPSAGLPYDNFENTWFWKAARLLLPGQCLLCLASAKHSLCMACLDDLPCLGYHCKRCAIPLSATTQQDLSNTGLIECGSCQAHPPSFDKSFSAFTYAFPIDKLIHEFKNSGNLRLGKLLSVFLIAKLKQNISTSDQELPEYIVPVAMHRSKKLKRRFNQAEFIAKELSHALNTPIINAFKKIKATPDQHSLNRKQRIENLKGCFKVNSNSGILANNNKAIKHVAIVDDVMTTGTTANELSKLLKQYGVEKIEVWSLARTPRQSL